MTAAPLPYEPAEPVPTGAGPPPEPGEVDTLPGRLVGIFISPGHDYWGKRGAGRMQHGIRSVDSVQAEAMHGLVGDRYHRPPKPPPLRRHPFGRRDQVTLLSAATVDEVRRRWRLRDLPAGVFRRNLLVALDDGVDLAGWLDRRFRIRGQDVILEGSQECTPCHWMDRCIAEGVMDYLKTPFRGGLRARILTSGTLHVHTDG